MPASVGLRQVPLNILDQSFHNPHTVIGLASQPSVRLSALALLHIVAILLASQILFIVAAACTVLFDFYF